MQRPICGFSFGPAGIVATALFIVAFVMANFAVAQPRQPRQPASPTDPETLSAQALIARAEVAEIHGQFGVAKAAREIALRKLNEQIATCRRMLDKLVAPTGEISAAERAFAEHWQWILNDESNRLVEERNRCQFWLTELTKPKAGIIPLVNAERQIVWKHERKLSDALARLNQLETANRWAEAHQARRKTVILSKANLRFFKAKADAMARMKSIVNNNRQLRNTNAVEIYDARGEYYKMVIERAERRKNRLDSLATAQQSPRWNQQSSAFFTAIGEYGEKYGVPGDMFSTARRAELASRAEARGRFYAEREARLAARAANPPNE